MNIFQFFISWSTLLSLKARSLPTDIGLHTQTDRQTNHHNTVQHSRSIAQGKKLWGNNKRYPSLLPSHPLTKRTLHINNIFLPSSFSLYCDDKRRTGERISIPTDRPEQREGHSAFRIPNERKLIVGHRLGLGLYCATVLVAVRRWTMARVFVHMRRRVFALSLSIKKFWWWVILVGDGILTDHVPAGGIEKSYINKWRSYIFKNFEQKH